MPSSIELTCRSSNKHGAHDYKYPQNTSPVPRINEGYKLAEFYSAAIKLYDRFCAVISKFVNGVEIPHSLLVNGGNVLAAGEANIISSGGYRQILDVSNHSGHYLPSANSLDVGVGAFEAAGFSSNGAEIIRHGGVNGGC